MQPCFQRPRAEYGELLYVGDEISPPSDENFLFGGRFSKSKSFPSDKMDGSRIWKLSMAAESF